MRRTAFTVALAVAGGFGVAQAQDYQMEVGAGYSDVNAAGADDSALDVGFTVYFDRVSTGGLPLSEAAFLRNASNLSVGYVRFDDADVDATGVQGEFWFDRFYLLGGYVATEFGGTDVDTLSARAGWMLAPGLRLSAGVDRVDVDAPGVDVSNDAVIEAKYVAQLGGGTAFNLEGNVTFLDEADDEVVGVEGDYYFNPAFSVGGGLSFADDDDNFELRSRFFFTPMIAGQIEYSVNDGDDDIIRVSAVLRF